MIHSLRASEFILAGLYIVAVTVITIIGVDVSKYKELWDGVLYLVAGYGVFRQGNKLLLPKGKEAQNNV